MKVRLLFLLIISIVLTTNCGEEQFVGIEPISTINLNEVVKTADGVTNLVNSVYGSLPGPYNWSYGINLEQMSDDSWSSRMPEYDNLGAINDGAQRLDGYSPMYRGIMECNFILERTSELMDSYSESAKEIITVRQGEAYFLRALFYFNLVRLWGEVPLITEYLEDPFQANKPRAPIQDIYAQIKSDINAAVERLPPQSETDNWRANIGAGYTLKAKIHITLEEWDKVILATDFVINNLNYNLVSADNYGTLWGENMAENSNAETIFEIEYEGVQAAGSVFNKNTHTRYAGPTDANNNSGFAGSSGEHTLMQTFEDGDTLRKYYAIMSHDELADQFKIFPDAHDYHNRKYYLGDWTEGNSSGNHVLFRYADVLLMKAEAENEVGVGNPITLINQIRNRVGLSDYNGPIDKVSVRHAIWHERRVELVWEQKRYFDLNRWGVLLDTLRTQTGLSNMSDTHFADHPITGKPHFFLPLPAGVKELNPNLETKYGY